MVATDGDGGGTDHRLTFVNDEVSGLRAYVDNSHATCAVLRIDSGVGSGGGLEDGLLYGDRCLMRGIDERLVLLRRTRNDVHVRFKARANQAAGVPKIGPSIDCEVRRRH